MSSSLILYGIEHSPAVRAVLLTLKALEVPFEFKVVDLLKGEQHKVSFKRLNKLAEVPVLDDNGTIIVESHCICKYLVDKFGKDDALYPQDLVKRAVVNARLFMEASVLWPSLHYVLHPLVKKNATVASKEKIENIYAAYEKTESFLAQNKFIAGDHLTIADFSFLTSLSVMRALLELDPKQFPKTLEWFDFMTHLSYYEETNAKGVALLNGFLQSRRMDKTMRTKPAIIYFTQA